MRFIRLRHVVTWVFASVLLVAVSGHAAELNNVLKTHTLTPPIPVSRYNARYVEDATGQTTNTITVNGQARTLYAWTRGFTDAVASVVPTINRVVAYGHPHPDKLRCFFAYAWCCVPILAWVQHRYHEKYNKPLAGGAGALGFWVRWTGAVVLAISMCFLIWYWPNFPGVGKDVLAPIARPHDELPAALNGVRLP
jgi:hypothetical protein